jgi:trans-aconitate 2-methyltransferase
MPQWNPDAYLKYQDERTQPSVDLAARVEVANPADIIDIGCGPGNSTHVLRERWPEARITGLDSSPEMLEAARKSYPQEQWVQADASTLGTGQASWNQDPSRQFNLVFSNAALQWIPDHHELLPRLLGLVNPSGGALAFQVPANTASPLHQAVLKVARQYAWVGRLEGAGRALTYHEPGFYYDLLVEACKRVVIWQTQYFHVLPSHQGLVDWYAGTGMRPYLERLGSEDERQSFQRQVLEECRPFYPEHQDHKILFPFNRLFVIAYR